MNYHFIKNKYEIVKYEFPDLFDIDIYYLNEDYCQINVKRLDSIEGWGLLLEIKIFDLINENQFYLINFGNSEKNFKSLSFKSEIKLNYDNDKEVKIPTKLETRDETLILNDYNIITGEKYDNFIDIHLVIYYIDDYKIKIIIRRLDEAKGWNNDVKIILYDIYNKNIKQILNIGKSEMNYKIIFKETKIKINFINNIYEQNIPKNIFHTGYNNTFKSILHFNSIISFIELNPEYTYNYYNNANARKFLRDNFSNEVNYSYDLLVPGAYKADLLRYCLLYFEGGCYFDCKQILKVPIRSFLKPNRDFILCNDVIEKAYLNAVMFSTKKNKFIGKIIKDCVYNIINNLGNNPLDITGPTFLYKSIQKNINSDILILQNNRPPHNFKDFCEDYYNNRITLNNDNNTILHRFYKGYYDNYLDVNHYGILYKNNEIYYKNFQIINNYKICVYPNKYNDLFLFNLKDNNILNIKRVDSNDGWYFNLKVLIIDENCNEHLIEIGLSKNNDKDIKLYL